MTSYLGNELLILRIVCGKLAAKGLQEDVQLAWLCSDGPHDLKGTAFDTHDELSFHCGSLANNFVSG